MARPRKSMPGRDPKPSYSPPNVYTGGMNFREPPVIGECYYKDGDLYVYNGAVGSGWILIATSTGVTPLAETVYEVTPVNAPPPVKKVKKPSRFLIDMFGEEAALRAMEMED